MRTITVSSQKGGAAKTTTTISLGAVLAEQGEHVLLVDMDPQGHIAEGFGIPAETLPHEMSEVLDRGLPLATIIQTVRPNLDIAPANIRLSECELSLFSQFHREDKLKDALRRLQTSYDFVLIDCPPSLGILTVNALSAAGEVLIPMACDYYSMLGVDLLLQTIEKMRAEINPELRILGILPTRLTHTVNARAVLERTRQDLGNEIRIFEPIPETVRFREASSAGKTVFELGRETPGAQAYLNLAKGVLSRG